MSDIILSICICSLPERAYVLQKLIQSLIDQCDQIVDYGDGLDWVKHLVSLDGIAIEIFVRKDSRKSMTTGAKRNILYNNAEGKYVCSIDDDDEVSPFYISAILKALESDPDAVAINGIMITDGRLIETWDISRHNPYATTFKPGRKKHYLRYHNHLSPVRRSIAVQFPFPDVSQFEDYAYAKAMHDAWAIKTEVKIPLPLYIYRYNSKK